MLSRITEWIIINLVFRGGMAMSVGLTLEVITHFALGTIFGYAYLTTYESLTFFWHVVIFLSFHVIGWMLVLRDWDFITGDRRDIDPMYATPYPETDFTIDRGSYVIKGNVYRKA